LPPATSGCRDERESLRVLDAIQVQVDVELRPVEMLLVEQLDVANVLDARVCEPRETLEIEHQLAVAHEQP
jgi:hypothetical protein